jgi:hypothetical protein
MLTTILIVAAFVLLLLAAVNIPSPHLNLGWMGLALWVLAELLRGYLR